MPPPPPDRGALSAACALADALSDPRALRPAAPTDRHRADLQNLAGGAIGVALLHVACARAGHRSVDTAHRWLTLATSAPVSAGGSADLFYGAPALGFAFTCAGHGTGSYRRVLAAIDERVARLTHARLAAAAARIERGDSLPMHEFDLVHGLTGLGVYHLARHPGHRLTRDVLSYLVRITTHTPSADILPERPAWWLAGGLDGQLNLDQFPNGHGNLGMAHGISGVLALLAHAVLHGVTVPGADEAIIQICKWFDQWHQSRDGETWWPGYLTADNLRTGTVEPTQRPRPSWCYGISGSARAQQLAGLALADTTRQHAAEAAMLAALRGADREALGAEVGLCHGIAGMLHSAWRMAADASTCLLADELTGLGSNLIARLPDPTTHPELMDGTAGAALALLTLGTGIAPASGWDSFLLLA